MGNKNGQARDTGNNRVKTQNEDKRNKNQKTKKISYKDTPTKPGGKGDVNSDAREW